MSCRQYGVCVTIYGVDRKIKVQFLKREPALSTPSPANHSLGGVLR